MRKTPRGGVVEDVGGVVAKLEGVPGDGGEAALGAEVGTDRGADSGVEELSASDRPAVRAAMKRRAIFWAIKRIWCCMAAPCRWVRGTIKIWMIIPVLRLTNCLHG